MQTLYHLFFWLKNKQNLIQSTFPKAASYFILFNIQTSAVCLAPSQRDNSQDSEISDHFKTQHTSDLFLYHYTRIRMTKIKNIDNTKGIRARS